MSSRRDEARDGDSVEGRFFKTLVQQIRGLCLILLGKERELLIFTLMKENPVEEGRLKEGPRPGVSKDSSNSQVLITQMVTLRHV
ncbi:hypothetical protein GN956_G19871 [Arapaima gigas]